MARIKGAMATRKRRKKVLKAAKGYYVYRRKAKGKTVSYTHLTLPTT